MLLFKKIWVFPVLFFLFSGCRKPTSANWDVDVVLPVVNSTLNIKNFIGDSIFTSDNTGILNLSLNREIATILLDSLLSLPDTTIAPPPFYSPLQIVLQPGEGIPPTFLPETELKFDVGDGVALKRVDIRKCIMSVKFSNNIPQPLDFVYTIPNATKFGLPFTITETVPTGTNSLAKDYDLSGYSMNMTGSSGYAYNTIVQKYELKVNANATSAVTVNPSQGITILVNYSKIVPQYVEGYFGKQVIDIDADTVAVGLINNFKADNFMLSEANMNFKILNEFGAEFTGNLDNIRSINTQQNTNILLNSKQFSNININTASKVGNTVYPSVKPVILNSTNSNVTSFISNFPDKLTYKGKINLNPNGNISGYHDFAFYNTGIRIIADINIPLRFTANYFQLKSLATVDFAGAKQLDNVNSGHFVISSSNGYPFDAKLQAYMLDANNVVIDSLFSGISNTIERGQLNAANEVIAPTRSRVLIPISQAKIANLRKAKSIQIVSLFIMPPNPPEIKIFESYKFDVNIIAELNYNVGIKN